MRKSQITLLAIIGLFIAIAALLIYFYIKNPADSSQNKIGLEDIKREQIQQSFESCMATLSYPAMSESIARFGGFEQEGLDEKNAIKIADNYVALWNKNDLDASPKIEQIEEIFSQVLSAQVSDCFEATLPDGTSLGQDTEDIRIEAVFLDDHFEARLENEIPVNIGSKEIVIQGALAKFNYNIKRDFEIAKKILHDALAVQPGFYDITMNCIDYNTNGKTNIYSIDVKTEDGGFATIISVIDYEPTMRDKEKAFRINFALKDVNVMGFCAG